jgi:hypothetical protein
MRYLKSYQKVRRIAENPLAVVCGNAPNDGNKLCVHAAPLPAGIAGAVVL